MNPLAGQLNESIKAGNSHVYDMLSTLGKEIYFPKEGILASQPKLLPMLRNTMLRLE